MAMKTVLCCEDSLEGILCGVYEGWAGKYGHASVALTLGNPGQQELFVRYVQVPTETEPAQKVYRTVLRVMGEEACEQMELAAMSHREDKGTAIYQLIVSGFHMAQPGRVLEALTLPGVQRVTELAGSVWKEAHHLMGFGAVCGVEGGNAGGLHAAEGAAASGAGTAFCRSTARGELGDRGCGSWTAGGASAGRQAGCCCGMPRWRNR